MPEIICLECGVSNDKERHYCRNCGFDITQVEIYMHQEW